LVLTFDHRLINGVGGADFLNAVATNLENAETLVERGMAGA
jgi:pyruvate/2-oxoglutarate dehydrogenase complex dihydrolipoamide acyltransferase (E2) component